MAGIYDLLLGGLQGEDYYRSQDPLYMGGASILQMPMPTPQTNTQAILGPALQGLLGGALLGMGKRSANEAAYQAYSQSPFLQGLISGRPSNLYGPMTQAQTIEAETPIYGRAEPPPGWSVNQARPQALLGLLQQQAMQDVQNKQAELINELAVRSSPQYLDLEKSLAEAKSAGTKAGELSAYKDYYATGQSVDPETSLGGAKINPNLPLDPIERGKALQALENTTYQRIADSPIFKQFSDINANFKTLVTLKDKEEAPAAPAMITSFSRILDPTSTVREGEYKTINQNVQSFLDSIQGNWRQAMQGKTALSKKAREAMVEIAAKKYNEFGKAYQESAKPILESLIAQGGNAENVPVFKFEPYAMSAARTPPPALPGESKEQYLMRVMGRTPRG